MRCLYIAVALNTANTQNLIIFNGKFNALAQKKLKKHNFQTINSKNLDGFSDATLILDDYCITQDDISFIRTKVKKFIKIDDFNQFDLSSLDLIINFRNGAESEEYSNKNTCLGLNYFPFKKPLIDIRKNNLNKLCV
jgi:spore coat polysaccharide biosynthesis predicted glycosyltransferase SpsG